MYIAYYAIQWTQDVTFCNLQPYIQTMAMVLSTTKTRHFDLVALRIGDFKDKADGWVSTSDRCRKNPLATARTMLLIVC